MDQRQKRPAESHCTVDSTAKRSKPDSRSETFRENAAVHNATVPFLRLPVELRLQIYELAVGGRLVHLYERFWGDHAIWGDTLERQLQIAREDRSYRLWHCACRFNDANLTKCDPIKSCRYRHMNYKEDSIYPMRLNLALLQTCRQVFEEARLIPFSANTFSFHDPTTLALFLLVELKPEQASAVKHLRLEFSIKGAHFRKHEVDGGLVWRGGWAMLSQLQDLLQLRRLTNLHLSLNKRPAIDRHFGTDGSWRSEQRVQGLLCLRGLNPSQLTVTVSDMKFTQYYSMDPQQLQQEEEKRPLKQKINEEFAQWLRDVLLMPWDPEREGMFNQPSHKCRHANFVYGTE